jgi:hypothetical protein
MSGTTGSYWGEGGHRVRTLMLMLVVTTMMTMRHGFILREIIM